MSEGTRVTDQESGIVTKDYEMADETLGLFLRQVQKLNRTLCTSWIGSLDPRTDPRLVNILETSLGELHAFMDSIELAVRHINETHTVGRYLHPGSQLMLPTPSEFEPERIFAAADEVDELGDKELAAWLRNLGNGFERMKSRRVDVGIFSSGLALNLGLFLSRVPVALPESVEKQREVARLFFELAADDLLGLDVTNAPAKIREQLMYLQLLVFQRREEGADVSVADMHNVVELAKDLLLEIDAAAGIDVSKGEY